MRFLRVKYLLLMLLIAGCNLIQDDTPRITADVCKFEPDTVGVEVPIYAEPDPDSEQVGSTGHGDSHAVVASGGTWTSGGVTGTWYQIVFEGGMGWVADIRGELVGNCENLGG